MNWCGLNILYELPIDESFLIETYNNVECRSLNRMVTDWRVLLYYYA